MELKAVAAEFSVSTNREFTGYASVFGNRDSYGDIVQPGAFARTINNDRGRIKVLWQHHSSEPIGLPVEMHEDSVGLHVTARIAKTSRGNDALALIEAGVVNELSIGFDTIREEWDSEKKERRLVELRLWEFSPVTWAANELAKIVEVKNASDLDAVLDRLDRLKWAGGRVESERLRERIKSGIQQLDRLLIDQNPPVASPSGTPQADQPAPHDVHAALAPLSAFKNKLIAANVQNELRAFGETLRSKA